jgi:hypothetical protein
VRVRLVQLRRNREMPRSWRHYDKKSKRRNAAAPSREEPGNYTDLGSFSQRDMLFRGRLDTI